MTFEDDVALDLKQLPPDVLERVKAAAEALNKVLPPGRTAVAQRLAEGPYVVVSGAEEHRAYEIHEANKLARGDATAQVVTKLAVAVHYFMRTNRHLVDGAGKHAALKADPIELLTLARMYRAT